MAPSFRVLITDPLQRAALAAARALGRAGHQVVTIGDDSGLAGASRFVEAHVPVTSANCTDPTAFPVVVRDAVVAHRIDVVVPITDASSRTVLPAAAAIGVPIAGPRADAFERASDKALLMQVAPTCGLRVPRQQLLCSAQDHFAWDWPDTAGVVIKPVRSIVEREGRTVRVGVRYAASPDALRAALSAYPAEAFPVMVQERCPGEGVGVFLLRDKGHTLLAAGHRRLREKPPSGGVSTYRESVLPDSHFVAQCEALLDAIQFDGPAMVEFKRNPATGDAVLMEINARLWGSVQLAVHAGANFPVALVEWAMGVPLSANRPRAGVRCAWEFGELDHALALWRQSRTSLNLPPGTPVGAGAALRALATRGWRDHGEVFEWRDPRPFVAEAQRWVRDLSQGNR